MIKNAVQKEVERAIKTLLTSILQARSLVGDILIAATLSASSLSQSVSATSSIDFL